MSENETLKTETFAQQEIGFSGFQNVVKGGILTKSCNQLPQGQAFFVTAYSGSPRLFLQC